MATAALVESLGEAKREVLLLMQKDNYSRFKVGDGPGWVGLAGAVVGTALVELLPTPGLVVQNYGG